ncbi:hypothetical protein ACFQZ4_06815 [Catellatospora coxensis]
MSRNVTDSAVAAEAATLRLKVSLGRVVLLDAALGHLQVKATSAKPWAATAPAAARRDTGAAAVRTRPSSPAGRPRSWRRRPPGPRRN